MIKKVYNISLIATSVFAFIAWTLTQSIKHEVIEHEILRHSVIALLNFVLAFGFFNMFAKIIISLSNRIKWVKRLILGSSYIEGVWVGYTFVEEEGEDTFTPRYTTFMIEQSIDDIVITVKSHAENLSLRTFITPEVAWINKQKRVLYMVNSARRVVAPFFGSSFVEFHLVSKGLSTSPEQLEGIVTYLEEGSMRRVSAKKLSTLPHKYEPKKLLEESVKFYQEKMSKK